MKWFKFTSPPTKYKNFLTTVLAPKQQHPKKYNHYACAVKPNMFSKLLFCVGSCVTQKKLTKSCKKKAAFKNSFTSHSFFVIGVIVCHILKKRSLFRGGSISVHHYDIARFKLWTRLQTKIQLLKILYVNVHGKTTRRTTQLLVPDATYFSQGM